jgi:hypothetical protein
MPRAAGGVNKTKLIADYLKTDPSAKAAAIVQFLKEKHGVNVSPAYASTIKSKLKTKSGAGGKKKARRGRPPKSASAAKAAPASTGTTLSVDGLLAARDLVARAGGIAKAKAALELLAKLNG